MLFLPQTAIAYLLVFALVFSITYAILSRSKFFYRSDIPALISVAVGLAAVVSQFFVVFVVSFIPYILALLVFIFALILLLSTAMVPIDSISSYLKKSTIIPISLVFIVFIFGMIAYGETATLVNGNVPVQQSTQILGSTTPTSTSQTTTSNNPGVSAPTNSNKGIPIRISFSDITSQYIISILTAPTVLSLILSMAAMAMAVFFMTRDPKKS
ncbi:MAG: hypothetical protein M1433_02055 [Candidatus Parvarchaeota archaeon]|nr:hypothetical protein [Candidatus Parvarchaeota archaeon]